MTLVLAATLLPLVGAGWASLLVRRPRVALAGALLAAGAGGGCALVAGLIALLGRGTGALALSHPITLGGLAWRLDALSAWFLVPLGLVTAAAALHSWGYVSTAGASRKPAAYGALFGLLVSALVTVFTADDVVLFLIGWEMMSAAAFFLVSYEDREPDARRGAWFYLVASHLGTALLIFPVLILLAGRASSTSFAAVAGVVEALSPMGAGLLFAGVLIGFGTKAGFTPLHVWLPVAHPVAPSPVSAMMSGVVIKTGIYGILRVLSWNPALPPWCPWVLFAVAALTGVYGILSALGQGQLKRMLAFSSVENIGIVGLGIAIGLLGRQAGQPAVEALGFGGALLHVLNHALFKGLLFLSAGAVLHEAGTGEMARLGGLARRSPANAALFAIGCAAICALPPLNGFVGEWLIYRAFLEITLYGRGADAVAGVVGVVLLAVIGGLAIAAFARTFGLVFLGEPRSQARGVHGTSPAMIGAMGLLAAGCVAIGLAGPAVPGLLARPVDLLCQAESSALAVASGPLIGISGAAAIFAIALAALLALRGGARREEPGARPGTWGCGFAAPTPRMQYSSSSFAWSLLRSFRLLVRSSRTAERPAGCFPAPVELTASTPDAAETAVWRPIFGAVARMAQRCLPLQHGRIQLYLLYVVAAVLVLFVVETWSRPGSPRPANPPAREGRK